jgi:regulator of sirC expression with transglutaminase-like and TPR domain
VSPEQLPALLKLLDDPSPTIRAKVRRALREFGTNLPRQIINAGIAPTESQQEELDAIMRANLTRTPAAFGTLWQEWRTLRDDYLILESALDHLARVQFEWAQDGRADEAVPFAKALDALAAEFRADVRISRSEELADWLFGAGRFRGVPGEDYYLPFNSNLLHVVEVGEGLPISLVIIFMLVGRRVGIEVYGAAFPGHFLARAEDDYFDCYNGGRVLSFAEMAAVTRSAPESVRPATAPEIVARVIANMANAYQFTGEREKVERALLLLEQLREQEMSL